eukprot:TRINITY_DN6844_c0_g1_i1.p1 TRINITY_DN6844_c0_g1~~TRINITY_DN6844_c0_g1_i1.p1  ORF type:complete len:173 (+),score=12.31 TRINITY_DN6844_c0_g1_i1:35-553(+)
MESLYVSSVPSAGPRLAYYAGTLPANNLATAATPTALSTSPLYTPSPADVRTGGLQQQRSFLAGRLSFTSPPPQQAPPVTIVSSSTNPITPASSEYRHHGIVGRTPPSIGSSGVESASPAYPSTGSQVAYSRPQRLVYRSVSARVPQPVGFVRIPAFGHAAFDEQGCRRWRL